MLYCTAPSYGRSQAAIPVWVSGSWQYATPTRWGPGEPKSLGASFSGKMLTWGLRGLEAQPSGAGPATTVLHGLVQVEREGSRSCE